MQKPQKKRKYNQRVLDGEHDIFAPLALTTNGAMSFETRRFYQRSSELLSKKLDVSNKRMANWKFEKTRFVMFKSFQLANASYW